jgi:hypothetical protein
MSVIERVSANTRLANLKSVALARYDRQECLSYVVTSQ